jgi:hypothetical protein
MKTSFLLFLALTIGISVSAQKIVQPSTANAKVKVNMPRNLITEESGNTSAAYIPGYHPTSAPGVFETPVGMTTYDLQSNASVQNRIYAYPDGTVGAVWTIGFIPPASAFSDRGTGYNYFDGTSWGEMPTARIASETKKNGWPSYAPLGAGEMVISHTSIASGLYFTSRPAKGTGNWTSTFIPNTPKYVWPRAITNGNTIHVLVNTAPVANGGTIYQGLDGALVYLRSTDQGVTWSNPVLLPGLDAASLPLNANFKGIGGDNYSWAAPRGDSIAFVVTDGFGGIWAFKSFDNGVNWTKVTAFTFPNLEVDIDYCTTDDKSAIAMDKMGKVHIVTGRTKFNDDNLTDDLIGVYLYTDGLLYWNEDMPVMDTTLLGNLDTLQAHGNLIGYMVDYNANDIIDFPEIALPNYPFGRYGFSSLSSMPQIAVDNNDNIFVSFSQLREDLFNEGANPNIQLYRHLFLTSKMKNEGEWIEPRDLTDDIEHAFDECVFASMSYSMDDKLHILYQVDGEPGYALDETNEKDAYGDNYINYLTFPTFVSVKPVDIAKDVMVSPNPASDFTNVQVSLLGTQKVELNVYDVMGKLVMNANYGQQTTGYHTYQVNTSSLTGGIYLFTVKIGNSQTSRKVVVQ